MRIQCSALLVVTALGCGARSELPGLPGADANGPFGPITTTCKLSLSLGASRVYESEEETESLRPALTLLKNSDDVCYLSLRKPEDTGPFAVHQRCAQPWDTVTWGPDVQMGPPMQDNGGLPPADLFTALSAIDGFAMLYRGSDEPRFAPSKKPLDSMLPTISLPSNIDLLELGAPSSAGNFLLYETLMAKQVIAGRLGLDGAFDPGVALACDNNVVRATRTARAGNRDLVAMISAGEKEPDCVPGGQAWDRVRVYSVAGTDVIDRDLPATSPSNLALTPFGADQAWLLYVTALQASPPQSIVAKLLAEDGSVQRSFVVGPYDGGFGVAATELGGGLLVIDDAARAAGDTASSAGFHARLVDPSGVVVSELAVPVGVPLLDAPGMPTIVTNPNKTEALLGFYAQPTGKAGRDYIAKIRCEDP